MGLTELSGLQGTEDTEFTNDYELIAEGKWPDGLLNPCYWRILVAPVSPPKVTKGGIYLPDVTTEAQEYANFIGRIVKAGPLAFRDKRLTGSDKGEVDWDKLPNTGDWVMFARHAGMKLTFRGFKLVVCNDDDVIAILPDPKGYKIYV